MPIPNALPSMFPLQQLRRWAKEAVLQSDDMRVAIVGDSPTQLLAQAFLGMARHRGLKVRMMEADYGQVEQQLCSPDSALHLFKPHVVVMFWSAQVFSAQYSVADFKQRKELARQRIDFLSQICLSPLFSGVKMIVLNCPETDDGVYGAYASKTDCSLLFQIRKFNLGLMQLARQYDQLAVCDINVLQNMFGRQWLFSPNLYASTEMALSMEALPWVASRLTDILLAQQGNVKKCVVVDLDNTIWGGVIGDDGMEGIQLGHALGIGRVYSDIQRWLKLLRQRGIILCVASKNDERLAKEPFLHHPEMVLRMDDIAVFLANFETKVDNLRMIQQVLNIGFDSMVFLDDNPFERDMVRTAIQDICVPELPEDPALWLDFLSACNLFETASMSAADKERTRQYQEETMRRKVARTYDSEGDFLKALGMKAHVEALTSFNIPRVAQLSQRSNQFNLRTQRYGEDDLKMMAADKKVLPLCISLKDKYGDHGLVAVVIMKVLDRNTLFVNTWMMSCRVLKRGMEQFTRNIMVEEAKRQGYSRILGEYLPTKKNALVKELYHDMGFETLTGTATAQYVLNVDKARPLPCHISMKVE